MKWFVCSLICIFSWGGADIFYKKGSDREDSLSHLKYAVWLGLVMGIGAFLFLPLSESGLPLHLLIAKYADYAPLAFAYALAMLVGIAGRRYLDASVISPLENIDGALATILVVIWFLMTGSANIMRLFNWLDLVGIVLIILGVVFLGVLEQKLSKTDNSLLSSGKKRRIGTIAFLFPMIYSLFDAISIAFSSIVLYDDSVSDISEIDFMILESCAFAVVGLVAWIYMAVRKKKVYLPLQKEERFKGGGALLEFVGNYFFLCAAALNPMLTGPVTSSYCVVTLVAARIFLKEKLNKKQYLCLLLLLLGILLLGISEVQRG